MSRFSFGRRSKVQAAETSSSDAITSPTIEAPKAIKRHRPSFKLTDFPTEIERPSLPVTPAPVRRNMFWGEERNVEGELPIAEGVPQPADWDPIKKLEDLQRQQSAMLEQGPRRPSVDAPERAFPVSAALHPPVEEAVGSPLGDEADVGLEESQVKPVSATSHFG